MKELIEKIEVDECVVKGALKWVSESTSNNLDEVDTDGVIRYLLKRTIELEKRIEQLEDANVKLYD